MADKLKPEHTEIVEKIRILENEVVTAKQRFKKYHNYYAPEDIVKSSKYVLSFGVGGNCAFEKLMCFDNPNLEIQMFDPTPWTRQNINAILNGSGKKYFKHSDLTHILLIGSSEQVCPAVSFLYALIFCFTFSSPQMLS